MVDINNLFILILFVFYFIFLKNSLLYLKCPTIYKIYMHTKNKTLIFFFASALSTDHCYSSFGQLKNKKQIDQMPVLDYSRSFPHQKFYCTQDPTQLTSTLRAGLSYGAIIPHYRGSWHTRKVFNYLTWSLRQRFLLKLEFRYNFTILPIVLDCHQKRHGSWKQF